MEATDDQDAGDYDKTFLEEPAILDKYKAAADVSESKYKTQSRFSSLNLDKQHPMGHNVM